MINFLMGLHCHQPVDNFEAIFEEAYAKSYDPFLRVLARHPGIKLSLHYSGPLLGWIARKKPDFITRVKELIKRNQVEILTGGYFEPILPMIPRRDAKGQIEMLTAATEKYFGYTPSGAWLAERVWDPELVGLFHDVNLRYTILDDFHLRQAGVEGRRVFGRYSVKNSDNFSVFASIKKLRYTMPFRDVDVTMDFLRGLRENPDAHSVTFADDCEKFGLWPYTYDWVYKKGWLERFFTALEESDWIRTMTFKEALLENESLGRLEIPRSSYAEMIGWCNGDFDNFFKKYPESNLMRNRMLCVSEKLKRVRATGSLGIPCEWEDPHRAEGPTRKVSPSSQSAEQARDELYKAQSNCAYWHGVFGGIYTNYLRHGIYSHIIKAENLLEDGRGGQKIEMVKFQDGTKDIIRAENRYLALFINPDYAGSLFEIDYKPRAYNLIDTMSRCYEPYHEKLEKKQKRDPEELKKKLDEDEPVDLYEVLGVREKNLKKFLNYDSYRKFSCLAHVMDPKASLEDFIKSAHAVTGEKGFFGPFKYEAKNENGRSIINLERVSGGLKLNKCIILERSPEILMKFDLENISAEPVEFIFGVEFNWSLEDKKFMRPRRGKRIRSLSLLEGFFGVKVTHFFTQPVDFWSFPVYTLNESERGLGKSFQEISLLFHKKLSLGKGARFSLETQVRISG